MRYEDRPYRPCVGIMLVNAGGQAFAAQRLDNPGPAWQMPQGGIDKGEAPDAAALRELWEETGVTEDLVQVLGQTKGWLDYDVPRDIADRLWGAKYRGQRQKWFLMRFLGSDEQVDITREPREFSEWKWVDIVDLPGQIVPFKRDLYEAVIAELAPKIGG